MTPEAAMRLALAQARRASGRTFPNPAVGAVVFRGDRVLGVGRTRPAGGAHAEVVAIEAARRRFGERLLRGASLAVTLEPCSHVGRTAPCADLVARVGIARVHVGHVDPHPAVSGGGVRWLRRAGARVRVGVLEAECREQHRGFLAVVERGRPFVALKLASTLDGRIATASGESRWITGERARACVHRLRARADAILVGSGTALADDPELTARRGGRVVHRPWRVLVDSRLRVPASARIFAGGPGEALVLCADGAPRARRLALEARGVRVLEVAGRAGGLDLRRALARLAREGPTDVLVEGGGALGAALLRAGLVDEVHWFSAARLLGADGREALGPLGVRSLARAPRLGDVCVRRLGGDLYVRGRLERPRGPGRPGGEGRR
jgi:diaminohydroxyphosphoribosylaminopyrimidine deaminase/5-amino-6-(5-phosphoribosylamino)uracil reductase